MIIDNDTQFGLRKIRRMKTIVNRLALSSIPFVIFFLYAIYKSPDILMVALYIFIAYLAIFGFANMYLALMRCPNCNKYFFMKEHEKPRMFSNHSIFRDNCANCGIYPESIEL